MADKNSSMLIWFCCDKNQRVQMFLDEPVRNTKLGKFEGKYPYVNSVIYKDFCEVVKQAKMNFNTEPQVIEIQIQK